MNFERDMIPEPKPGGRPRKVDLWEIRERHFRKFYVKVADGDGYLATFPHGRLCTLIFLTGGLAGHG